MSYNLLKGKKGLIFGALNEQSIAWKVAERAVEEGAEIVLTNTAVSIRMGTISKLAEKCNTIVVPADATSVGDLENLIDKTMEHFGGKFDFMLHSIGMSPNVRKGRTYDDLDYDFLSKTLDISAISFHKAIQVARKKDAINDWGSIVALSYIAAQRTLYGYNDMADAKALLESIARSFGYIYGREKHVRINTVSQSPTPTTAGSGVLGLGDLMGFILNEGVDIPGVNMVLFLRPTESSTIFLQQLGRGLRKYTNKPYVTILDFIGNSYKRSVHIALALGSLSRNSILEKKLLKFMVRNDFKSLGVDNCCIE